MMTIALSFLILIKNALCSNVLLLDPINNVEKSNSINFSSSLDHYSFNSLDSHLKDYNKVNKTMKKIVKTRYRKFERKIKIPSILKGDEDLGGIEIE